MQERRKDYDAAEAQYQRALILSPNDPSVLNNYAVFLQVSYPSSALPLPSPFLLLLLIAPPLRSPPPLIIMDASAFPRHRTRPSSFAPYAKLSRESGSDAPRPLRSAETRQKWLRRCSRSHSPLLPTAPRPCDALLFSAASIHAFPERVLRASR